MSDIEFLKLIGTDVLSDNWGTLTKYTFDYRRRDGNWQRQSREVYDRGNGVTCLLYNPDTECVLLTRQFRLPVWVVKCDPFLLEVPAGLLEGAHPEERMRQELIEETGFEVSALEHLYDLHMSPGSVTEHLAFYRGHYHLADKVSEGGGEETEGEDIEVLHVPLDNALDMISNGEIRDGKTVILLQDLALFRLRRKGK
ncbi:MAG: NUDIX domain-containing protein [Roseibium sp.]